MALQLLAIEASTEPRATKPFNPAIGVPGLALFVCWDKDALSCIVIYPQQQKDITL